MLDLLWRLCGRQMGGDTLTQLGFFEAINGSLLGLFSTIDGGKSIHIFDATWTELGWVMRDGNVVTLHTQQVGKLNVLPPAAVIRHGPPAILRFSDHTTEIIGFVTASGLVSLHREGALVEVGRVRGDELLLHTVLRAGAGLALLLPPLQYAERI